MDFDKTREHAMDDVGSLQRASAYLIVLAGKSIGQTFRLEGDEKTIGRSPDSHVLLEDDGVSRRHARIERTESGGLRLVDLQSTNGTWFDGEQVNAHLLRDGDRIQIGSSIVLKFSYQDELEERFQQQLYDAATRDGLTRLYNKRFFLDRLTQDFSYSLRHEQPLTLVLFDVDHFKEINDSLGHPAGDSVLQELAGRVAETLRTEDLLCRYGGDEFAIIMREASAERGALVAERVRRVVANAPFSHEGGTVAVTVSLGVVTLEAANARTPGDLLGEADRRLYEAKQRGRNQVASGQGQRASERA